MHARPEDAATAIDFGAIVAAELPDWSVRRPGEDPGRGDVWVYADPPDAVPVPSQGWKLHVSATITSAVDVLDATLPVLVAHRATFKVAWRGSFLARLNGGFEGSSQVGKFITIYPRTDTDAVALAQALVSATDGLAGPDIPTDRRLGTAPVHYRYGSFANLQVQNLFGQPEPGLVDPDGHHHRDVRSTSYRKPEWAQDPFESAGLVTVEDRPRNHVVDGRFLRLLPLVESARGSVYRGVDLHEGRPVVLKFARPDAAVSIDGRDASQRLRAEAGVLAALGSDSWAPAFVAAGEWQGESYVAMEEIPGRSATWHLHSAQLEGRVLDRDRVRRWATELAEALIVIHRRGFVYRDLKLANVMIDERNDRARLIDYELTAEAGSTTGQGEVGSRGYLPPRLDDPTLTAADDVYSFGALLWALATTTEPSFQPVADDLDRLDPYLLNPDADPAVIDLSRWCRAVDPDGRPSSMSQVHAMLSAPPERSAPVARTSRSRSGPRPAPTLDWQDEARRAGRALLERSAVDADGLVTWPSVRRIGTGLALRTTYEGSAGIVLAFASLVAAGETDFATPLVDATRWLVHGDDGLPRVPGLHAGEMGVAVALAVAGAVLDDAELRDRAVELAPADHRVETVGPDVVMGAAGMLRGRLVLDHLTAAPGQLQRAVELGDWLADMAERNDAGAFWRLPDGVPRLGGTTCFGYGHGAAGIADVLFDLAEVTVDDRFDGLAREALDWIETGAVERGAGLDWPEYPDTEPFGGWWCNGAGGIATVLARAGRAETAARAAHLTARMTWAMPGRCHGLAGNIECLLTVAERLGDTRWRDAAEVHGRLLASWQIAPGVYPGESPELVTPDYMVGMAGVIPAFLRLAGHRPVDPTLLAPVATSEAR